MMHFREQLPELVVAEVAASDEASLAPPARRPEDPRLFEELRIGGQTGVKVGRALSHLNLMRTGVVIGCASHRTISSSSLAPRVMVELRHVSHRLRPPFEAVPL
jgi:hypothetical protein